MKTKEEVAEEYGFLVANGTGYIEFKYIAEKGFLEGVEFTEQKLTPLMIEFADYCNKNYHITAHPIAPETWVDLDWINCYTTEQLLEQFIKTRK